LRRTLHNCHQFFPHNRARAREMHTSIVERGGVMREPFEFGMPDTAPYKEWLGVVGSIVVAALVGIVLFSGGILS
jgi:hypothetical protein